MIKRLLAGLAGGIFGGVFAIVAGLLLTRLILWINPRQSVGFDDLILGLLVVILIYPLGAGIGAGLILRRFSWRGMLWKAIVAAYGGEVLVMILAEPLRINLNTDLMLGLLVLIPIGAILVAFWFNRQLEETV